MRLGLRWSAVATLILLKSGKRLLKFQFHSSLILNAQAGLELDSNGVRCQIPTAGAFWSVPESIQWGDLFSNHVSFVRPKGYPQGFNDWFPIDFRNVVVDNSALLRNAFRS